jgi:hypothetical protein
MSERTEIQYAEVKMRVAVDFSPDDEDEFRRKSIRFLLELELTDSGDFGEFPNVQEVTLTETESVEEAAERQMAEAESAAMARQQRRYERSLEERGGNRKFR